MGRSDGWLAGLGINVKEYVPFHTPLTGVSPAKAGVQPRAGAASAEKCPDPSFENPAALEHVALPEDEHPPARGFQCLEMIRVPLHIAGELGTPVPSIRLRGPTVLAGSFRMLMPETPMHEDHLLAGPEDKVGFAGKVLGVEAVAVAHPVNEGPNHHLRLHARRADGGHVA